MARLDERIAEAKYETERAGNAVQRAIQQRHGSEQNASSEDETRWQLRELLRHAGPARSCMTAFCGVEKRCATGRRPSRPRRNPRARGVPNRPSSHNPILFIFPGLSFLQSAEVGWPSFLNSWIEIAQRAETGDALGISCIGLVPLLPRTHAIRLISISDGAFFRLCRGDTVAVATLGLAAGPLAPARWF